MQLGQPLDGTDEGPDLIRNAGLRSAVSRLGWRFSDMGDIPMDAASLSDNDMRVPSTPGAHNCLFVGRANQFLREKVQEAASTGSFVLTLGGDHSIAVGSIAGMLSKHRDLGVVWVDAHADINTPLTSRSGNMHGMPLGMLMKLMGPGKSFPGFEWLEDVPILRPEQVAYIGLRDIDDPERKVLHELSDKGLFVSTMQTVDAHGIGSVVKSALEALGKDRPLHLSYDIDALDPQFAPATGTVVRGGLSFREGHYVAEAVAETGQVHF